MFVAEVEQRLGFAAALWRSGPQQHHERDEAQHVQRQRQQLQTRQAPGD
jgi:hypothetical protein